MSNFFPPASPDTVVLKEPGKLIFSMLIGATRASADTLLEC